MPRLRRFEVAHLVRNNKALDFRAQVFFSRVVYITLRKSSVALPQGRLFGSVTQCSKLGHRKPEKVGKSGKKWELFIFSREENGGGKRRNYERLCSSLVSLPMHLVAEGLK